MTASAPAIARTGNPFARASLVLVVVLLVVTLGTRILAVVAPAIAARAHLPVVGISSLLGAAGLVEIVVALAAGVVGLVGVTRPGRPHGLAAAGMGIGFAAAASTGLIYVANLAVSAAVTQGLVGR